MTKSSRNRKLIYKKQIHSIILLSVLLIISVFFSFFTSNKIKNYTTKVDLLNKDVNVLNDDISKLKEENSKLNENKKTIDEKLKTFLSN
ncbi:hypothetical protein [Clostridium ihumii]|uniref:hypothetical protein n=1 Tax=Clostridium ihumii TaxID=1470356 RepID=UPI0005912B5D|nr:hypothetical protein [Clostridium ihumii]